ncbi:MAG: hypothetical protein LW823_10120 [Rickettsiales bacterium]|jgi:hypothetical protein|nr:hypothetical protein [Rickettsiales bacterium]
MADDFLGKLSEYTGNLVGRVAEMPKQAGEKATEMLQDFQAYLNNSKDAPEGTKVYANIRDWAASLPDKGQKYGKEAVDAVAGFWEEKMPDELKPKKGGFLDNNKAALGGMAGLAVLGMLLTGNVIGALIFAIIGFLGGSLMDGKNGIIGNLLGGGEEKKPPQTPGGESKGTDSPAADQAKANEKVPEVKVSVVEQDGQTATVMLTSAEQAAAGAPGTTLKGVIRGEDFIITQSSVTTTNPNGLDGIKMTETRTFSEKEGIVVKDVIKEGKINEAALSSQLLASGILGRSPSDGPMVAPDQTRGVTQPTTPTPSTPAQETPAATTKPPQAGTAPAQPTAVPAEQPPVAAATPQVAGLSSVAIMGDGGKPITKLYLNENGTAVVPGQESSAAVILQGRYEQGGELFRVESYAARKPDGSFMPMKNVYENGMLSPVTLSAADNQIDLSTEGNKRQSDKMITLANSYRDNISSANETRAKMERLALLSDRAEVTMVGEPLKLKNENDLITLRYTFAGESGKEYTAMLTAERSYSTSTTTTRGTGVDWANETRTTTTTANLRITSGSLLDANGKPYGGNFIDKPIMVSGLSVGSNGINYAAMPKIKPVENSAEQRIAQLNKPAEQPPMVAGEQQAQAIPAEIRGRYTLESGV